MRNLKSIFLGGSFSSSLLKFCEQGHAPVEHLINLCRSMKDPEDIALDLGDFTQYPQVDLVSDKRLLAVLGTHILTNNTTIIQN